MSTQRRTRETGKDAMNRKILNWHGKNMDVIMSRTANNRDTAYIWAIACAVKFILSEMEKNGKSER